MSIAKLFELVRKEQVVLWAGSGLSKYAGYPLGKDLAQTIYNSLSIAEQKEIDKNLSLADLSEQFIRIKQGRHQLNLLLKNVFLKRPEETKYHSLLANIPHIKTIITTNYDNLFEITYGKNATKIVEQEDIGLINDNHEIFKIHGDIDRPETIIITKSDYAKFFAQNQSNTPYWSVLTERISNKIILFIGYDLEDDNVLNTLEKTWAALKENRKEAFLIAPGLKRHKISYLLEKGIQYIDYKGEPFIDKLYNNIKENIVRDFNNGFVKIETLRSFFFKNNLLVDLKAFEKRHKIAKVRSANGQFKADVSFTFKNDEKIKRRFTRFVDGEEFGEMELDDKVLQDFKFSSSNINLLDDDISKYKLILYKAPASKGLVDIEFEDGFELTDIEYEIFGSKKKIQLTCTYKGSSLQMILPEGENNPKKDMVDFKFATAEKYDQLNYALNTCKFLDRFTQGMRIYISPQKTDKRYEFSFPVNEEYNEVIKHNLEFYELVKKVEHDFKVKFTNIAQPTFELYNDCVLALNALHNKEYKADWDGELELDLSNNDTPLEFIKKLEKNPKTIMGESVEPESVEIFGIELNLGYRTIEYKDLYIVNIEDVESGKNIVKLKSKTKTAIIVYNKVSLRENQKDKTEPI